MNQIEWRANSSKKLVAFENSKALSDFDGPEAQAESWIQSIAIDGFTEALCIVGCGSGYHIAALRKKFPDLKIYVVESRPAIIGFFSKKFRDVEFIFVEKIENINNLENLDYLMSAKVEKKMFRPAIGYQADILEEAYWFLNIRTFGALSHYIGKEVTGSQNALISLKQFLINIPDSYNKYGFSEIQTLREIIK